MHQSAPSKRTLRSILLRIVGIGLSFLAILALMIGIVAAAGDPDSPIATTLILAPIMVILVVALVVKRRRK